MQQQVKQSKNNPHGLKHGDVVKLAPGTTSRYGSEALWSVISIDAQGLLYLQHSWINDARCGADAKTVVPYMTDHVMP